MRIVHLHPGFDTGGQSMAGKRVLEAAGDEVRVFVHSFAYFGYPPGELWDDDAVQDALGWADVVVVHNDPTVIGPIDKPVIVHHHGSRFRSSPDRIWAQAEALGATQIVSTVDLLLSVPSGKRAHWLPQVVDLERMVALRAEHDEPRRRLRITHAPTNKAMKGTRWVQLAARALAREADYTLINREPWAKCLAIKAASDIFVDQLKLGYGANAVEAWALGLPVVAGATPDILAIMRETFGTIPFMEAGPDHELVGVLRSLIRNATLRERYAEIGMEHVKRFHSPSAWLQRARALYGGEPVAVAA